jgi:subtilisin family serine protease
MPFRSRVAALLTLGALTVAPLTAAHAAPADRSGTAPDVVPGEVLVKWAPGAAANARAAERARLGLKWLDRPAVEGYEQLRIAGAADPRAVAAQLRRLGSVAEAQPNFVYRAQASLPNDPGFRDQWGLHQLSDIDLDVPEAWQTTRGSSSVVVAVIDTGVDISHVDLKGNIWRNPGEIAGNGIDDDGNGYVDDVNGWDFRNGDATVFDDAKQDAHGTHVAGTVAALADNGTGVASVAPGVKVMPLKFLGGTDGSGSTSGAIAAIRYATAKGAKVINASWGTPGGEDKLLRDTIAKSGAVFVAAAGNHGSDNDATPVSPANLSAANIVSVASIDITGTFSTFSNYGPTTVDVGAPGGRIVSTWPGDKYAYSDGTSMAAPHVAGVAALAASVNPGLSATQIVDVVNQAAVANPLRSLSGKTVTGGMPNAATAVALASSTTSSEPAPAPAPAPEPEPEPAPAPEEDEPVADEPPAEEEPARYDGTEGRTLDRACPSVRSAGWTDVSTTSPHAPGIDCASAWEVFQGGSGATFSPGTRLTRGQLASVLARAIEQATGRTLAAGTDRFRDDDGSVHEGAINKLAALDIVGGVDATTYAPAAPVTRAQFAAMLGRTYRHLTGALPAGPNAFTDDDGNTHEPSINALAGLGVVTGDGRGSYAPGDVLTRAQSATMVARLIDALVEAGATA